MSVRVPVAASFAEAHPCSECTAVGIIHCCEGLREQPSSCAHCAAGDVRIKMRRQYVHYIDRKIFICDDAIWTPSVKPNGEATTF